MGGADHLPCSKAMYGVMSNGRQQSMFNERPGKRYSRLPGDCSGQRNLARPYSCLLVKPEHKAVHHIVRGCLLFTAFNLNLLNPRWP